MLVFCDCVFWFVVSVGFVGGFYVFLLCFGAFILFILLCLWLCLFVVVKASCCLVGVLKFWRFILCLDSWCIFSGGFRLVEFFWVGWGGLLWIYLCFWWWVVITFYGCLVASPGC